jgi:hypothetical protein
LIERGTFGYDLDREKDVLIKDMDKSETAARRKEFLDRYTQSVMALPG